MRRVLLAIAVPFAAATPEAATTVTAEQRSVAIDRGVTAPIDVVLVHGDDAASDLRIAQPADDVIEVSDALAPPRAGAGCVVLDADTVRCANLRQPHVEADLAGGADRLQEASPRIGVVAQGGPGDDVLTAFPEGSGGFDGGPGDDRLTGGTQSDRLRGGPGADIVTAGAGDDVVEEGDVTAEGDDVLDGGPGVDVIDYTGRNQALRIDLAAGFAGRAGERDAITDFENAIGGNAPDVVLGDNGPNELTGLRVPPRGGPGDRLVGRGGDDVLSGTELPDRFEGGRGDDEISGFVWEGRPDVAFGGPGDDDIDQVPRGSRVDCGAGDDVLELQHRMAVGLNCDLLADSGDGFVPSRRAGRLRLAQPGPHPSEICSTDGGPVQHRRASGWVITAPWPRGRREVTVRMRFGTDRCRRTPRGNEFFRLTVFDPSD